MIVQISHGEFATSTILKCPVHGCDWSYVTVFGPEQSFKLIDMHMTEEHTAQDSPAFLAVKTSELTPSRIDANVDPETWQAFAIRWSQCCKGSQLSAELQSVVISCSSVEVCQRDSLIG